jgi:thymidylate synthase (FAD)
MNKIEVQVIQQSQVAGATQAFLAKLTQRGHKIQDMKDLNKLYINSITDTSGEFMEKLTQLPHGTIQRFTPITVAIVGASRRFLMQARTHQVGVNYVSASCQYSDYSHTTEEQFVVPYELMEAGENAIKFHLTACNNAMSSYKYIAELSGNDTAGYVAPHALRNVLIMQANHDAWKHMIKVRTCNRNTTETQYVFLRIWEELLKTHDGDHLFKYAGPTCISGHHCEEGHMACKKALSTIYNEAKDADTPLPRFLINAKFPLLNEVR